ncbi:MAG: GntP family permease, partial [Planctomycetota bacterium]
AAGGAFGTALRQTGVGSLVAALPDLRGLGLLTLAWAATLAVRTAQGSATVAMVVAAGLVGSAIPESGVHPVWVACAIGCGSKAIAWMNSSGFWVVARAGGLTEREALATFTPLTIVLAVAGLAVTLMGAWLWPTLWTS